MEKGGIVTSLLEGKTRIYRLNPDYPLKPELESLLKTAYTLLSPQEKRKYCFIHKPHISLDLERARERKIQSDLASLWERLRLVKNLTFSAKLRQGPEMEIKMGKGEVAVSSPLNSVILFQEKGYWYAGQIPETVFTNTLRWTLDKTAGMITLEHLRYGAAHPVFLFHLAPTKPFLLESIDAHLCGEDTYLGTLTWSRDRVDFHWRIIGPGKNDELTYQYR
jgi:hypothetical protein